MKEKQRKDAVKSKVSLTVSASPRPHRVRNILEAASPGLTLSFAFDLTRVYRLRENPPGVVHATFLWQPPRMITDLLRQQFTACILDSLREQAYAPPSTPDNTVRDAFFTKAASIVLARIRAEGWGMEIPKTLLRDTDHPAASQPSDMTLAMIEEDLRFSICLGLKLYRLKPPRSRDPAEREQWLRRVAESVVERILMSNWALAPMLQKLAPTRRHSTSDFMGKAG